MPSRLLGRAKGTSRLEFCARYQYQYLRRRMWYGSRLLFVGILTPQGDSPPNFRSLRRMVTPAKRLTKEQNPLPLLSCPCFKTNQHPKQSRLRRSSYVRCIGEWTRKSSGFTTCRPNWNESFSTSLMVSCAWVCHSSRPVTFHVSSGIC